VTAMVEIEVRFAGRDEEVAGEILAAASARALTWHDVLVIASSKGAGAKRAKRIVAQLVGKGLLIELPCRVFVAPGLERAEEAVREAVRCRVRGCPRPVAPPLAPHPLGEVVLAAIKEC